MGRFTQKLVQFFTGRYGNDRFNRFLWWSSFAFLVASLLLHIFLRSTVGFFVAMGLYGLSFLLLVLMLFRALSRNIPARTRENLRYAACLAAIGRPFRRMYVRFRDRKTHIFRKCPACKKVLRLPRTPGSHFVHCPCCGRKFAVKVK